LNKPISTETQTTLNLKAPLVNPSFNGTVSIPSLTGNVSIGKSIISNKNIISGWNKLGQDIDGEGQYNQSGNSVSISSDGKIMAIGAIDREHVRVYKLNESTSSWQQLGQNINRETGGGQFSRSVSISSDGKIVAIGAPTNNDNGNYSGNVRVYKLNESTISWQQLGQNIYGEARGDNFGISVNLSSDGKIVAIGARFNDGNGNESGHVRVYKLNESTPTWQQLGQDIDGEAGNDFSGESVSLSSDGKIVAIGARFNYSNGSDSGHVRVYKLNESTSLWQQIGQDIDGEKGDDYSGTSVSLSSDGKIVAIGASFNDGNGNNSGHVRVYKLNISTIQMKWEQLGQDIDGEAEGDQFGRSVSISSDGKIVAVGAYLNDANTNNISDNRGHVRVYKLNESTTTPTWQQIGQDIDGEAGDDNSGESISLSSDGKIVAIGASFNDGNGNASGHVRVYKLNYIEDGLNIPKCTFTETVSGISKEMVGLGNVDDTSDASKPISTATQSALNAKAPYILINCSDDNDARDKGVPIYGLYRTENVLKMRTS
jgi:uncharacterized delta-60 repeat protein